MLILIILFLIVFVPTVTIITFVDLPKTILIPIFFGVMAFVIGCQWLSLYHQQVQYYNNYMEEYGDMYSDSDKGRMRFGSSEMAEAYSYKQAEKDSEIKKYKKEIRHDMAYTVISYVLCAYFIVLIVIAPFFWHKEKKRQREQKESETQKNT